MAIETRPERPAEEASQAITPKPFLIDRLGSRFRRWNINPKGIISSISKPATEFRSSLYGVPMKLVKSKLLERPRNFLLRNAIQSVVKLSSTQEINGEIKKEAAASKVFILIINHQQHIDGFVFAVIGKHTRCLVAATPGASAFPGFIAPAAKSWEEGHQGGHLQVGLEFFRKAGEQVGVKVQGATRKKDENQYAMGRYQLLAEMLPIAREMCRENRGLALLPEGSWKGGRHSKGAGVEDIHGMQPFAVNMVSWINTVQRVTHKEPVIIVGGLNGSYRCVWNREKEDGNPEDPRITPEGWRALILGMFGLRIGYRRIEAKLQSVITLAKLEAVVPNWRENGEAVNNYLSEQIEEAIPPYARRKKPKSDYAPAIELSRAS